MQSSPVALGGNGAPFTVGDEVPLRETTQDHGIRNDAAQQPRAYGSFASQPQPVAQQPINPEQPIRSQQTIASQQPILQQQPPLTGSTSPISQLGGPNPTVPLSYVGFIRRS